MVSKEHNGDFDKASEVLCRVGRSWQDDHFSNMPSIRSSWYCLDRSHRLFVCQMISRFTESMRKKILHSDD